METKAMVVINFYSNGNKRNELRYQNNAMQGLQRYYFSSGNIDREFYTNKGQIHGVDQDSCRDGLRGHITQWKNGAEHGPEIKFKYGN